jgi:hypothetical protein
LVGVVVKHLVACYQGVGPQFSLALALTGDNKEAEDAAKGDLEVSAIVAKVTPRFPWV